MGRWAVSLMTDIGQWPLFVVAASAVVPFAYISIASFPTGRYYIPMLPALYAMAGLGIAATARWAMRSSGGVRVAATSLAAASVALALVWGVGFVNGVYGHTNTRIEASEWIARNVPPGSVLSSQAWDDGLPLRLPGLDADQFIGERFDMVGPDDEAKVATIAEQLGRIDYVIESSARIWGTVTRMPNRFPSTINFFDGLDSGALGFERVATFRSGISLGSWQLDDEDADEAFSVFDHPQVRIWRKVRDVDRDTIVAVLDPIAAANAVAIDPTRASANGLLLTDGEIATNETGPTYDQAFDTDGSNALHVLAWFVLLEVLGIAAFAMFAPLLQSLPDAGWGLAKILALGTLAFALFIAAAWLHVDLDRTSVGVITAAFVVAGAVCAIRRRVLLSSLWRERRAVLITVEVLCTMMFLAFVLTRAMNPDLWHPDRGGEKPFEMALLTAVLRTKTLPVYDPWYSHGALNYYYGGWLLLSAPARVLRTSPTMVMNVAIAVFASCAAGGGVLCRGCDDQWDRHGRAQAVPPRADVYSRSPGSGLRAARQQWSDRHDDLAAAQRECAGPCRLVGAQSSHPWLGGSHRVPGVVAAVRRCASARDGHRRPARRRRTLHRLVQRAEGRPARPLGPTRDRAGSRHRSDPDDEHVGLPPQHRRDRDDGAARAGGWGAVATSHRPRHRAADRRRPRVVAVRAAGGGLRLWLRSGRVAHPSVQLVEAVRLVRRDLRDGRRRTARRHVPALATGVGMDHARPSGCGRFVARRSGVFVAATRIRDVRDQRVVGTRMRLGRLAASRGRRRSVRSARSHWRSAGRSRLASRCSRCATTVDG